MRGTVKTLGMKKGGSKREREKERERGRREKGE